MRFLTGGWRDLPAAWWPPRCLACEAPGAGGRELCGECADALPRLGRVRGAAAAPFAATVAAFRYAAPVDGWLRRFKFHGDLAAGRLLATLLADAVADADAHAVITHRASVRGPAPAPRPAAIVPLPLHRARLRERGYDQALELAKPLSRALALPLRADALLRVRATQAQTELGGRARRRNVRGAFALRGAPLPAHVALVDDVMTTGATLAEAARVLRAAGVARVDAWVVALAAEKVDRGS